MVCTAGSVMSEFGRKLGRGTWAIRDIGPTGQQSASRPLCVSSVGRDAAHKKAKAADESCEVVPA